MAMGDALGGVGEDDEATLEIKRINGPGRLVQDIHLLELLRIGELVHVGSRRIWMKKKREWC